MDLTFLTDLYEATGQEATGQEATGQEAIGPVASVYVDTTRADESGAREVELRWSDARARLAEQGADEATLKAMDPVVGSHSDVPGRTGQAVFAAGGSVLLDRVLPSPPRSAIARWSALPHVLPLLAQAPAVLPHVVVITDRVGAEVRAFGPAGESLAEERVRGEESYIRKVRGGGWAHLRYLHTAEDTWTKNAGQVAEQVDELVRRTGAGIVIAAGDVRAREKLREQLSRRARDVLVEVEEGGAAAGASEESLQRSIEQVLAESAAYRDEGVLDRYREEVGRHDRAASGVPATLAALRRAQVDTLIMLDDPGSEEQLWVGPDPTLLAVDAQELRDLGVDQPVRDRADAALVRAATGTGAQLLVVAPGQVALDDGVGALLRYADLGTPS